MTDVTQMSPAPTRTGSPLLGGGVGVALGGGVGVALGGGVGVALGVGVVDELAFTVDVALGPGEPAPPMVSARVGELVDSRLSRATAVALGSTIAK
jgi:hypothetical protein